MRLFIVILLMAISPLVSIAAEPEVGGTDSSKSDVQVDIRKIPFTMPDKVISSVQTFASGCEVVTLGEVHGTQEVPLIALALLTPLSKLGYGALALEIPKDEQVPLIKWASGKKEIVPDFFAKPSVDGRGNAQLLSLIQIALSPPYSWKLICFDQSKGEAQQEFEEMKRKLGEGKTTLQASQAELEDEGFAFWRKRDAAMASNLAAQLRKLTPRPKVLAICGNIHNRIENNSKIPELQKLWPSFASVLQRDNPDWKVGSVNIQFQSGSFFNGGKVQDFRGQKIEQAEARTAIETGYHWELKFPHANSATFLSPPTDSQ